MIMKNKGRNLICVLIFCACSIFFSMLLSKECDRSLSIADLPQLEEIALRALKGRPSELGFLGLERDGSNLELINSYVTSREPPADQITDHPIDLATLFLYTEIIGKEYRFSFNRCGELMHFSNLNGFNIN